VLREAEYDRHGSEVWKVFRKLPEVLDAVRAVIGGVARGGLVTLAEVAALFEVIGSS